MDQSETWLTFQDEDTLMSPNRMDYHGYARFDTLDYPTFFAGSSDCILYGYFPFRHPRAP